MTDKKQSIKRTVEFDIIIYNAIYAAAIANSRTFPAQLKVILSNFAGNSRVARLEYPMGTIADHGGLSVEILEYNHNSMQYLVKPEDAIETWVRADQLTEWRGSY